MENKAKSINPDFLLSNLKQTGEPVQYWLCEKQMKKTNETKKTKRFDTKVMRIWHNY